MDKQEMEAYLFELDTELARAFPSPEPIRVLVVGGACLLLSEVTERPTKDIDVIITDIEGTGDGSLVFELNETTRRMRQIILKIGKRRGLPARERMVLNDDCAPFLLDLGALPQMHLFRAYRKLHLYIPDFSYILACKLMAGRPGKDYGDIAALQKVLGIQTRKQAQALVNRFFPSIYHQQLHGLQKTLLDLFPDG